MKKINFTYWDLKISDILSILIFLINSYILKYIPNKEVFYLEKKILKYLKCKEAILVSSCTGGLHTALWCLGIGKGDEVITTPLTFSSTINTIMLVGASPVFIDVDKDSYNIDCNLIEKSITKKTKAILVVDLFGNPCNYDVLKEICKKYKLFLIADSAQAFGAQYKGKKIGSLADVTCFSFEISKNISSLTGGLITTNNRKLASRMRSFINYGVSKKKKSDNFGLNYRPNDLLARLLSSQLDRVDSLIQERNLFAHFYREVFANKYQFQFINKENISSYNYLTINLESDKKARFFVQKLSLHGVEATIFRSFLFDKRYFYRMKKFPVFNRLKNVLVRLPINKKLRVKKNRIYIREVISIILKDLFINK